MRVNDLIKKTNEYTASNQPDEIIKAATLAEAILNDICSIIIPGISESQATASAHEIFSDYGIEKLWHRPLIRFNQHTLCTYRDRPHTEYILQDNDIAFVDIGIVKDGIEGDVGKTLVFGENEVFKHLKNVSELLFRDAIQYWQDNNPTGIELYKFIHARAHENNVEFNLSPAGHLIGAFPHTHGWTKGANTFPESLNEYGWIIEIQIKCTSQPYGAFYEGILRGSI
jgi:Xaa-Pro aminopeptidase